MQIFVVSQSSHLAEFSASHTVGDVKAFVARSEGLPSNEQVVCYAGVPLSDDSTLAACAVNNLATLQVTPRLFGGKVHGSLARAGKVKSQTPKKDKEEKSKKLTGRAKRRAQYNLRFVNVVAGFGKKKGPNSNTV